jgi:hypothetical protein
LTSAITNIVSLMKGFSEREGASSIPSALSDIYYLAKNSADLVLKMKYFTIPELINLASASFLTMQIKRPEISIKDLTLLQYYNARDLYHTEYKKKVRATLIIFSTPTFAEKTEQELIDFSEKVNETGSDNKDTRKSKLKEISSVRSETKYKKGEAEISSSELEKELNKKGDLFRIGSVYVCPIVDDSELVFPKHIPFQFNPSISESSQSARYESMTILSRLGNLQSYTGTDSLSITLNTKYVPVSLDTSSAQGWLNTYDMKTVQLIELSYRSLILPYFTPNSKETGYKYFAPPLIKIIIGDYKKLPSEIKITSGPYSNFLTYPQEVLTANNSNLFKGYNFRNFRTFIATGVQINKDMNENSIFIHRDGNDYIVKDTIGFEVSLSLVEITPSYKDVQPGFHEYYNAVVKNI